MTERSYHTPVLLRETLEYLIVKLDGSYLDGTLGGGGHFRAVAQRLRTGATMVGIDRDPEAVAVAAAVARQEAAGGVRVIIEQSPFSEFDSVLMRNGVSLLDGVLLDLGVSSRQIDEPARGFSYMNDANLDMRMDPSKGITAEQLLGSSSEQELAGILERYGEIQNAERMARVIKHHLNAAPLRTSSELKECLYKEYGPNLKIKVLAKVFQALRIAVNDEMGELESFLGKITPWLAPGGRLVVIAYHSLEDRIVKNFIREQEQGCVCPPEMPFCSCGKPGTFKRVNKKAVQASDDEIVENPRSRSARLRVAEKLAVNGADA